MSWLDRFFTSRNYGTIQSEGAALAPEPTLNFIGAQVEDDTANQRTNVTLLQPAVNISALNIDWSQSKMFKKTLAAGANALTFSNARSGMVITVKLTGNVSTVTWPAGIKWTSGAPPTQTPSGIDVYTFLYDGTDYIGNYVQNVS